MERSELCVCQIVLLYTLAWDDGKIRAFYPESGKQMYTIHSAHNKVRRNVYRLWFAKMMLVNVKLITCPLSPSLCVLGSNCPCLHLQQQKVGEWRGRRPGEGLGRHPSGTHLNEGGHEGTQRSHHLHKDHCK